jgi:hypothetical protein
MGTRGFVGVVVDGEVQIQYQQYDSYPEGVGVKVLDFARQNAHARDGLRAQARAVKVVSEDVPPTLEQQEYYKHLADTHVSTGRLDEWYCLLRTTQGDLAAILGAGIILDAGTFPADSLFCEWGYIIDTDTWQLEVYKGFQTKPHVWGRFANMEAGDGDYYPVALVAVYKMEDLPTDMDFLRAFAEDDD